MSTWGGDFESRKDDVSDAMRWWLDNPGHLSRLEIIGHIAECLQYAASQAAHEDKAEAATAR